jgi:Mg-chelatase subunit ChlD
MKPDLNHETREQWEVRIVALLLGEASPFETAEVEQAMQDHPELAAFHDQMRRTVSLAQKASKPLPAETPQELKLSPERRETLLARFKQTEVVHFRAAQPERRRRGRWVAPLSLAAGVVALAGVVSTMNLFRSEETANHSAQAQYYLPAGEDVRNGRVLLRKEAEERVFLNTPDRAKEIAFAGRAASRPADNLASLDSDGSIRKLSEREVRTNGRNAFGIVLPSGPVVAQTATGAETASDFLASSDGGARYAYGLAGEVKELNLESKSEIRLPSSELSSIAQLPVQPGAGGGSAQTFEWNEGRMDANHSLFAGAFGGRMSGEENAILSMDIGGPTDVAAWHYNGDELSRRSTGDEAIVANPLINNFFNQNPGADASQFRLTEEARADGRASEIRSTGRPAPALKPPTQLSGSSELQALGRAGGFATDRADQSINPGSSRFSVKERLDIDAVNTPLSRAPAPKIALPESEQDLALAQMKQFEALPTARLSSGPDYGGISSPLRPGDRGPASPAKPTTPASPTPQPEINTRENPFSTFSLNVSDVSFKLAAASLESGAMPEPGSIRVEEFVNAFNYRDPAPAAGAALAFAVDRAAYPFAHNRDILRFSIQTAALGRDPQKPLNLVVLLDNSGSMERPDRVQIVHQALTVLAHQLQPRDRISVITFARTARLWIDGMAGGQPKEFLDQALNLNPEGGTNLEDALDLAYSTALRHFMPDGMNRVILLTDGAANLGNVDPEALKQTVVVHRGKGVALDCFGIGWEGYNDDLLEVLSRNGDGRYGFLDRPEEAAPEFANQLAGALNVAASDVKTQVQFNPRRVLTHRQVGYARHQLTKEQFRDNTVDAAEIAAAESGNALYVVQIDPQGSGPIGVVRVRYKVPATGEFVEQEWAIPYQPKVPALDQAGPAMRLAVVASAFGEWLSRNPYAGEISPSALQTYLQGVPETFAPDPRPERLAWMIRQAQAIGGE